MALPYSDQRNYFRMDVECPARFRIEGSNETAGGIVKNLSGDGVLLWLDNEIDAGALLSIVIMPGKNITPPLSMMIEVVRCYPLENEKEANFAAACIIKDKVEAEKLDKDFP